MGNYIQEIPLHKLLVILLALDNVKLALDNVLALTYGVAFSVSHRSYGKRNQEIILSRSWPQFEDFMLQTKLETDFT